MKNNPINVNLVVTKVSKHVSKIAFDEEPELSNDSPERTETHSCDCGKKETHGDDLPVADAREDNPLELPSIFVAEGYDSIEDEDGNMGFGVYVPRDKQIYVAGEVPYEMFVKALFHELAHWVQDVAGHEFSEDEANDFAERVYETIQNLPSAEPDFPAEIITCKNCQNDKWCSIQEAAMAGENFFCGAAERRTDE